MSASMPEVPRIADRLIDQVAVAIPLRVRPPEECVGDLIPPQPSFRRSWNQARREPTGDGDVDLLTTLDPAHQFRCVLTRFTKPDKFP